MPTAAQDPAAKSAGTMDPPIRAVVALGNPGRKYAETRHNVGWMVADALAARHGLGWQQKFNGEFGRMRVPGKGTWVGQDVSVLKPGTFMNLSGHPTQAMAAFYGYAPAELLVMHDELDLPFGRIQIKAGGGHGGHNGLRSLVAQLGDPTFVRVRIGIGRVKADGRPEGKQGEQADFVLAPFATDERPWLPDLIGRAADAVQLILELGVRAAMNTVHGAPRKGATEAKT